MDMTNEQLAPGDHGGDGASLARTLGIPTSSILDLSQSLNPVAPPVGRIIARHLDELTRYPDTTIATKVLAEALGVDAARVVLTNGGSEAIALVAAELGRGWVDEPDFSLYRRHLAELDPDAPRFRSNPHNPTGLLAAPDDQAAVWDEAFYTLATGEWTRGDADHGAIVVGSLTKLFACPGLRVGYILAPDDAVADRLRARQPLWSVNSLASAAVPDLIERAEPAAWARAVAVLRNELVRVLRRNGLVPAPSDANWVLVERTRLREVLLPHGIIVRDCASFGMVGTARIAVPTAQGLERLDRALSAVAHR